MLPRYSVYIGFDHREADGFAVTRRTVERRSNVPLRVRGLVLSELQASGLYTRPTEVREGRLYDVISEHPMSTEFAVSRFLVPYLACRAAGKDDDPRREAGWALFMDSDMLVRSDLFELFHKADPSYAVMCVKHNHVPTNTVKMDGQVQSVYSRKNWSSVMLFNCDHPSNQKLTLDLVNGVPGRDLHAFCWLEDHEIGALDPTWNYLIGASEPIAEPKIVHFTEGLPSLYGYQDQPFADEWRMELANWAL